MAEKPRRSSRGRQKVEMVKMKNETNLQVTFSKRYKGLYKKANELCSLTSAEVAIIGFSPKNKPFSFGCPDLPSILDKYQNPTPGIPVQLGEVADLQKLNEEIMSLEEKLRQEKKRGRVIDAQIRQRERYWWEAPMEEHTLEQSEQLKKDLMSLRSDVLDATAKVLDLSDCYVPIMDFDVPQHANTLLSSINGGNFAGGANSRIVPGFSPNNQIADLNHMQIGGASRSAGRATIDTNVQPILGERSSIDLHYDPMASESSNDPLFPHLIDYLLDETKFLDLCFGN